MTYAVQQPDTLEAVKATLDRLQEGYQIESYWIPVTSYYNNVLQDKLISGISISITSTEHFDFSTLQEVAFWLSGFQTALLVNGISADTPD